MCVGQNVLSPIETHNGHSVIISTTALVTIIHVIFAYSCSDESQRGWRKYILYTLSRYTWNSDV